MLVIDTIDKMQQYSTKQRKAGKVIGVVPTMGYLHDGHLSLIEEARKQSNIVIVTIFVNPTQFAPNEDFDQYPRDLEKDLALCEKHGVDIVFHPTSEEMYPSNASTWVFEEKLSQKLCGASRPDHFKGVTTVVTKLFNATLPDLAVFGQKDAQQVLIIKRMVRDLNIPVNVVIAPIVRESDGLAMSSRNKYLSSKDRQSSIIISKSLFYIKDQIESNQQCKASEIISLIECNIKNAGGCIDYVKIVDTNSLASVEVVTKESLIAVAAFFGKTRLIDNIIINPNN